MFPEVMAREQAEQYELEKEHAIRLARLAGIEDPESKIDPELTATVRFGDPTLADLIQQKARNELSEEALRRLESGENYPAAPSLEDVEGIGPELADNLRAAGFASSADLKTASDDELLAIDGIGPKKLKDIRAALA